jgi:tRNA1(Val) A37 N6-methylase TrmN6
VITTFPINEETWASLNDKYTQKELIDMLSDFIEQNNLPLPTRSISLEEAIDDFSWMYKTPQTIQHGKWFTRYDYKYPLSDIYFPNKNIGNKSSDYFHQEERWKCDSITSPSPYRTWHTEKFRKTLLSALWSLKFKKVDEAVMRTIIGLRKYIASQFRPNTCKDVINYFNAENVLDFSMGWGDRLSGFLASNAKSYTGVDPNTKLHDAYKKQYDQFGGNKIVEFIDGCAEDVKYSKKFDLVFTSPPYFNVEKYANDEKQSFKKYKKIEVWLEEFLYKAISNAWDALEDGGILAINISDVYSNHQVNKICDSMNDYISTLEESTYIGSYGYQMAKRPNSGALKDKEGVFCEPIWIWKKGSKEARIGINEYDEWM